jgi:hypothetical protein
MEEPYQIKFTRKRKRFFRSNDEETILIRDQCPGTAAIMANQKKKIAIPFESAEDNYRRLLLFYKTIKDSSGNIPKIPLDKPYLDKKEEDKFVADWKAFLNDRTKVGSYSTNAEASLKGFLGVGNKMDIAQFDGIADLFNLGWPDRDSGPLLAFNCKKRGAPGQGKLERFINNILNKPTPEQIELSTVSLDIHCKNLQNSSVGPQAHKNIKNMCIIIDNLANDNIYAARKREIKSIKNNEYIATNIKNILYILVSNIDKPSSALTSQVFSKMPHYLSKIFRENLVEDIHPQLAYLIWKDMGLRKLYWSKAFRGNYMPPNRTIPGLEKYKEALDALYFAICYYSTFIGTEGLAASRSIEPVVASMPAAASIMPVSTSMPVAAIPLAPPAASASGDENNDNKVNEYGFTKLGFKNGLFYPKKKKDEMIAKIKAERAAAGLGLTAGGANIQSAQAPMLPKDFYALPNREKFQIIYQNLQVLAENDPKITTIFDIAQWAMPAPGFFSKKVTIREVLRAKYPGRSDRNILLDIVDWYRENPNSSVTSKGFRPIASRWFGGAKGKKTRNRRMRSSSSRHSRKHITKKRR